MSTTSEHNGLPILEIIPDLKLALATNNTVLLQAPPGAGKSTILPIKLLEEHWLKNQKIIMLEPRKLAARAVAHRMADLLGESIGETVGYRVRFENKIGKSTHIEVVTEGILTRMLQSDNSLEGFGLVIFDEFHERSLHADLALALCREAQQIVREDLRILVMSATLDGDKLSALLGYAPILTSKGRQYPITVKYLGDMPDARIHERMNKAILKALKEEEGDVLAFLPGVAEILRTKELLEGELINASIFPLYGELSQAQQKLALQHIAGGGRKVVLATSIAETSLTIEGIKVVIDSGLSRVPKFDLRTGFTKLETIPATKDTTDQRAGRAGRLGPGIAYRLWSEITQTQLKSHRTPEILEADLTPTLLELYNWGIQDISQLTWLTPPNAGSVSQGKNVLAQLQAITENKITLRGKELLKYPTHPRLAHLLLEGRSLGLAALAADVAALLEERDPIPKTEGSDLALRVEALRKWRSKQYTSADKSILERVESVAQVWRRFLQIEIDNSPPASDDIGLLVAAAYPERIAKRKDKEALRYRLSNGRTVTLADHDPIMREDWLAIAHLDAGAKEGKIYMACSVNPKTLVHLYKSKEMIFWDETKGVLVACMEKRIGEIIVTTSPLEHVEEIEKIKVLCQVVKSEGLKLFDYTTEVEQWQNRLINIRQWQPHQDWWDTSNESLLATPEEWLAPYLQEVRRREDFKKLNLLEILKSQLSWAQQQEMDKVAPAQIKVPSGFMVDVKYDKYGGTPVLAVRLQEMFGLLDTPTINNGNTPVLLHLLSPGYKPVQVTQDLKSFWKNTYPDVRKELRVRYQKHHWPEDPWTAEAVRGVKKRVH